MKKAIKGIFVLLSEAQIMSFERVNTASILKILRFSVQVLQDRH